MKVKIILLFFLFLVFSLNSAKAESNAQNVTIQLHQILDFSSETDATVTDIIRTNEDWNISGNIGLATNIEVVDYFVYIDDSNNPPVIAIYRPTIGNSVQVQNLLLEKNKTLIRKYTILGVSKPTQTNFTRFIYFERGRRFFPLDEYNFLLTLPVQDYNQNYSADIIFPSSFEIINGSVFISRPCIEQRKKEDILLTVAGICQRDKIPESKSIEEYKYKTFIPLEEIPNSAQGKYFQHTQNPNKNYLEIKYSYGRPFLFKLIFFISLGFMFLVTYLSYPLSKEKISNYLVTIGSIWAAQESVSLLQGHRPLELTLYDYTIVVILIPLFLHLTSLAPRFRVFIQKKIRYTKQKLKNVYEIFHKLLKHITIYWRLNEPET